jgi:hypothetical protein
VSEEGAGTRRGRLGAYAAAFVLLAASVYAQAKGNLDSSLKLVWLSIGLSGLAAVMAVTSALLRPRAQDQRRPELPSAKGGSEAR